MKYLKYFETEAEHASYKNGSDYVLPNVSYVEENDTVFYESEEEFTEDELLYYSDGTTASYIINLTTLKVKKNGGNEEDLNIDENGNVVLNANGRIPGGQAYNKTYIMYWTSESVKDIPMNFEYTLYDGYENNVFNGEFNEMATFDTYNSPINTIPITNRIVDSPSSILEIKSKISNKTHRILFQ